MAEILEIREPKNLHAWVESLGGSRHYGRILQLYLARTAKIHMKMDIEKHSEEPTAKSPWI